MLELKDEIEELEAAGIPANKLVFIASNAHLITDFHRMEDMKDEKIGTTKRGNGPAYRDKYDRKGVRAVDDGRLLPYIVDMYYELYENEDHDDIKILLINSFKSSFLSDERKKVWINKI